MVHNPSNLYGGNAVVVNSQPSTNLAIQLLAKQQAKKDALNQYYSKLSDNTATEEDKMRPIDIQEGWGKKLNDYQTFFMNPDNKSKILKPSLDGYKTLNQFNAMHTDLIADARNSKDRLAQEKLVNVHRLSGKWNPTDNDMNETHNLSKSIYDPTRLVNENDPTTGMPITREPSVNNLSVNVPAYDANKESQFSKSAIGGVKTGKTYDESNARVDKKTGEIYLPYKEGYTPEAMKSIADNAGRAASVKNTPANVYYDHLKDDANFVSSANPAYQSVYGKTNPDGSENIIDTPQKAAAADYLIKSAQSGKTGEDKVTDWQTKQRLGQQFGMNKMYANDALIRGRQQLGLKYREAASDYNRAATSGEQEGILNKYIDNSVNAGTNKFKGTQFDGANIGGTHYEGKLIDVPHEVKYENGIYLGKDKQGNDLGWKYPDSYMVTNDKKIFIPIFFEKDKNNNPLKTPSGHFIIDQDTKPKDIQQLKVPLAKALLTKKQTGGEVVDDGSDDPSTELTGGDARDQNSPAPAKQNNKSYNVQGKSYSHKDLLNGGWTEDQINKAVKSGKIK